MSKTSQVQTLSVIARSPFTLYYEGESTSVSAANKVGAFDILPGHADFFTMLEPSEVVIQTDGEPITIDVKSGIITVRDNQAYLFLNM